MAFRAMPYAGAHGALTTLPVPAHPARRSRPAREANCSWLSVRAARRGPSGVCGVWDVWMGVDTCRHPWQTRPCAGDHQPMPAARELVGKRRTSIVRFGSVATDAESEPRDLWDAAGEGHEKNEWPRGGRRSNFVSGGSGRGDQPRCRREPAPRKRVPDPMRRGTLLPINATARLPAYTVRQAGQAQGSHGVRAAAWLRSGCRPVAQSEAATGVGLHRSR